MKYVILVMFLILGLSTFMVGGLFNYPNQKLQRSYSIPQGSSRPVPKNPSSEKKSLQIDAFELENVATCSGGKVAIDLLLDTSLSMKKDAGNGTSRMDNLKIAVKKIGVMLKDEDVIGIQRFSSSTRNLLSPNVLLVNRSEISDVADNLGSSGDTFTEKGLSLAKSEIDRARAVYPDHQWFLLLISDGSPDDDPLPLAQAINQSGVKIITMGFGFGSSELDYTEAVELMKQMANSPDLFFAPQSPTEIDAVVQKIANVICQ